MTTLALPERLAVEAAKPKPLDLFRYDPPVSQRTIAEWQRALDRVFEPQDRISRLVIRWEPGDSWQPIQRFIIWQCVDPSIVETPPMVRRGFRGPHPRSMGHYCAPGYCFCGLDPKKQHTFAWRGKANTPFDRATWELWRDTKLFGLRWWTIQGHRGGHRFVLDSQEYEAKILQMRYGLNQTPDPGELPYAPFDERVLNKIAQHDKVRSWTKAIDFAARNVDTLDRESLDDAIRAREQLSAWLDWGIEEAVDEHLPALKQYLRDTYGRAKPGVNYSDMKYDEIEQDFIHTNTD